MSRTLLLLLLACAAPAVAGEARISPSGHIVAAARDVRVFRGDAETPLFGSVTHADGTCCFSPSLPFVAGEIYRVELQKADGGWQTESVRFEQPRAEAPTVRMAPFPSVLPANALKVYLHFSQPMEQGVFLQRTTLRRQDGSVVQGAFRETELWSPDGKRLTLWLHPGRQKTAVNLNRDEGPVLVAGKRHFLEISGGWRSAAGIPLGRDSSFVITATSADHECPDPQRWKINPPTAGTRDPLRVTFDEPLDPAMLLSALSVKEATGQVWISTDARTWSWSPAGDWRPGKHTLAIEPLLEDLAGNNLAHPFEVDRTLRQPPKQQRTTITFDVR